MATIKRISPGSAFKVGAVVYAFLGVVVAALMVPFMMLMSSFVAAHGDAAAGQANPFLHGLGAGFGLSSFIIFPIFYAIIGGIGGALMALIYNLAAGWVGGLEVDIS
jgi:hypothetical protein